MQPIHGPAPLTFDIPCVWEVGAGHVQVAWSYLRLCLDHFLEAAVPLSVLLFSWVAGYSRSSHMTSLPVFWWRCSQYVLRYYPLCSTLDMLTYGRQRSLYEWDHVALSLAAYVFVGVSLIGLL